MTENPYQAPAWVEPLDSELAAESAGNIPAPITMRLVLISWLRWIGICGVSAIPSFWLGLGLTQACPYRVPAMLAGVVLFATGYVLVELFLLRRWASRNKDLYRSLCIGYGIRMAASICFPIGAVVDMFPGVAASAIFQKLIHSDNLSQQVTGIVATTLTQGILLNVILAAFIAFIYALFVLAKSNLFRSSRTRFRR
jgi:hypothetical protein